MMELFSTIAPGDAFILGVADNVTMPADLSRIVRIGEMVEEFGKYPVQVWARFVRRERLPWSLKS